MECVSTPTYFLAINGGVHRFIMGEKGLRQGDPISLYLFVLYLEYLSRLLKAKMEDLDFNFHSRCGQLKVTHLALADDLMLLARRDVPSINF